MEDLDHPTSGPQQPSARHRYTLNREEPIIPTYGRPEFLQESIDSVLQQSVQDFEIIVVDDCSPDPVDVKGDPRVRTIRASENGGPAAARNLGAENARGAVLTFLDDDDTWARDRLALAQEGLNLAPLTICWQANSGRVLSGMVHDTILDSTTPSLGATAIRRSAWIALDTSYRTCEDLVWWLAVSKRHRVTTVPKQGLIVRLHSGARSGYGPAQRIADSRRLLVDHADYFTSHRSARAFRLKRIGLMHLALGERRDARRAFARSFLTQPTPATAKHLVRAAVPRRPTHA